VFHKKLDGRSPSEYEIPRARQNVPSRYRYTNRISVDSGVAQMQNVLQYWNLIASNMSAVQAIGA
jgi:hypothetical protein